MASIITSHEDERPHTTLISYKPLESLEARQKFHSVLKRIHPRYERFREKRDIFENLCLSRRIDPLLNSGAQFGCDSNFVENKVGDGQSDGGERGEPRRSLLFIA